MGFGEVGNADYNGSGGAAGALAPVSFHIIARIIASILLHLHSWARNPWLRIGRARARARIYVRACVYQNFPDNEATVLTVDREWPTVCKR